MEEIIKAPQDNIFDICNAYAEISNGKVLKHDGYATIMADGFFYTRNIIDHVGSERLDEIIAEIKKGAAEGLPSNTTFTSELMPDNAEQRFADNGFEQLLVQTGMLWEPGSAADCATGSRTETKVYPEEDPHIKRIAQENLSLWIDAMIAGFVEEGKRREDVIYENLIRREDMLFLAYCEENEIMGTILLHLAKPYSGIHEVAVPVQYRGRGIASKMVRHVLKLIEENGSKAALQASSMGKPVYERFGFRSVSEIHTMFLKQQV